MEIEECDTPTTADMGLFIRDMIHSLPFQIRDAVHGSFVCHDYVESVDAEDPSNLVVRTRSGSTFIVRVIAA